MTLFHKSKRMKLPDIHTHNTDADREYSILNSNGHIADRRISMGIHPWEITVDWQEKFHTIEQYAGEENVCAIGECGIDKLKSPASIEIQLTVFKAHAMLAEKMEKPLIIHCVKGLHELIALHKEIAPQQAWIIHGFRGKPQQAEQLVKEGFHISYGEKFNIDSVKATPMERMFVESDESRAGIEDIYNSIAMAKECSVEELVSAIRHNTQKCNIMP